MNPAPPVTSTFTPVFWLIDDRNGLRCAVSASMSNPDPVLVPPDHLRFRRRMNLRAFLKQAWRARGLALTLTERELRARYKQALLGAAWAFATPLGYVVVFSVFFDRAARIETFGVSYPVFSYAALIPWGFFSQTVARGALSVVDNITLLNKVACPRETFVASATSTALFDMLVSATAFPIVVLITGEHFYLATITLLPVIVVQFAFALGLALLLSSVLVYLRDIRHLLPLVTQLLMFATPVVWGLEAVRQRTGEGVIRLYAILNPMSTVCESFRRALAFGKAPEWELLGLSAASALALLAAGYWLFKKLETGFADVA